MYKKKEVSTPPNKMKYITPYKGMYFSPNMYNLKMKEHIFQFLPFFVMIDKGYKKLESFTWEI